MQRYRNLNGDSGAIAFEIGPDFIDVEFHDAWIYRYTYASAGARNVEQMKRLALAGQGLSTFIVRNARKRYESKRPR